MKHYSLVTRLNLWYGVILVLTIALAIGVAEGLGRYLAAQRQVERVERVHELVRQVYFTEGEQAARELTILGVQTLIGESEVPSERMSPVLQTHTRLKEGVWLHTSLPEGVAVESRRDARLALLFGGAVALLLAFFGGAVVTRRALRPISEVANTAAEIITHGDTGARVPSSNTGDELDRMVNLFNALLDNNGQVVNAMRHSLDSIGHDLRTPLTRISSAAELGLRSKEEATEALYTCLEEAQNTEKLLSALLDLTRAEAGMLPLHQVSVPVEGLIERVVSLYDHVAQQEQVRLTVVAGASGAVWVDEARAYQALANLVDNAIKFSPPNSEVSLTAVVDEQRDLLGVQVRDQGVGIAEKEQRKVFERLYRSDESRSLPGSGLGLAMVQAIALAHGGEVELSSKLGEGTTVRLWFVPAVKAAS